MRAGSCLLFLGRVLEGLEKRVFRTQTIRTTVPRHIPQITGHTPAN